MYSMYISFNGITVIHNVFMVCTSRPQWPWAGFSGTFPHTPCPWSQEPISAQPWSTSLQPSRSAAWQWAHWSRPQPTGWLPGLTLSCHHKLFWQFGLLVEPGCRPLGPALLASLGSSGMWPWTAKPLPCQLWYHLWLLAPCALESSFPFVPPWQSCFTFFSVVSSNGNWFTCCVFTAWW